MTKRVMKYNPAFLTEEELVDSFVVRQREMKEIVEVVRRNNGLSNQHVLVIGPRGMGKTMFVLRVAAEVQHDEDLLKKWLPIRYAEESYGVTSPGKFWLEAIKHLRNITGDIRWERTWQDLLDEPDEQRSRERALSQLLGYAEELGKRLLLIVENFNMMLGQQLSKKDAWILRHTFQNEPRIMLLATSTTRFKEVTHSDNAMFEMFKTVELRPLNEDECSALWNSIASNKDAIQQPIRPIKILTGGSPRLVSIVAKFGKDLSLKHLMEELIQLVDDHTDYFKSQLDSIASGERETFVALAELWTPSTARQVARLSRQSVNKVSAQLKRLGVYGAVVVVEKKGKAQFYQLSERLFNIYYLSRCAGGAAKRVKVLAEFMVGFYDKQQLAHIIKIISTELVSLEKGSRYDYFATIFEIIYSPLTMTIRNDLIKAVPIELFALEDSPEILTKLLASDRRKLELVSWMYSVKSALQQYKETGQTDESMDILEELLNSKPDNQKTLPMEGVIYLSLSDYSRAEEVFTKSLKTDTKDPTALLGFGTLKFIQGEYLKAELIIRDLFKVTPELPEAWNLFGSIMFHQEKYAEAEMAFRSFVNKKPQERTGWRELGRSLSMQLKFGEAKEAFEKAVSLGDNDDILVKIIKMEDLVVDLSSLLIDLGLMTNTQKIRLKISEFIFASTLFAAYGFGKKTLDIIESSPSAHLLEPLIVGLKLDLGDEVIVAQEILEVGKDVQKRIQELREKMKAEKKD